MSTERIIRVGDCLASIGYEVGLLPDTIWRDAANAELRGKRTSPHLLEPGDRVVIPVLRKQTLEAAADERHRFRRKSVPEKLRLKLMCYGKPRAGIAYRVDLGDTIDEGTADDDGLVEVSIPPDLASARLLLENDGEFDEEYTVEIRTLRPGDGEAGRRQRLSNLGYIANPDVEADDLRAGLERFQVTHGGLTITGEMDDETTDALIEMHGS